MEDLVGFLLGFLMLELTVAVYITLSVRHSPPTGHSLGNQPGGGWLWGLFKASLQAFRRDSYDLQLHFLVASILGFRTLLLCADMCEKSPLTKAWSCHVNSFCTKALQGTYLHRMRTQVSTATCEFICRWQQACYSSYFFKKLLCFCFICQDVPVYITSELF